MEYAPPAIVEDVNLKHVFAMILLVLSSSTGAARLKFLDLCVLCLDLYELLHWSHRANQYWKFIHVQKPLSQGLG